MPIASFRQTPVESSILDKLGKAYTTVESMYEKLPFTTRRNIQDMMDAPSPFGGFDDAIKLGMVINPKTIGKFVKELDPALKAVREEFPHLSSKLQKALALAKVRYPSYIERALKPSVAKVKEFPYKPRFNYDQFPSKLQVGHGDPPSSPFYSWVMPGFDKDPSLMAYYANYPNYAGFAKREGKDTIQHYFPRVLHEWRHWNQYRGPNRLNVTQELRELNQKKLSEFNSKLVQTQEEYENLPMEVDPYKASRVGEKTLNRLHNYLGTDYETKEDLFNKLFRLSNEMATSSKTKSNKLKSYLEYTAGRNHWY